jgi:hypothetical protein
MTYESRRGFKNRELIKITLIGDESTNALLLATVQTTQKLSVQQLQ